MNTFLVEKDNKKYLKGYIKFLPTENFNDNDEMIIRCKQSYTSFRKHDDEWGKKGDVVEEDHEGVMSIGGNSGEDFHNRVPEFKIYYERMHLYMYCDERISDDDWCININNNEIRKITHSLFCEWYQLGWRKIISTTDPTLENPYILFEDEEYDLDVYRFKIFPKLKENDLLYFIKKYNKNKNDLMSCYVEWDTSDQEQWFKDLDDEFFEDYQHRMGIWNENPITDNDMEQMYETYFKPNIYVNPNDNTVNLIKDDLNIVSDPINRIYEQDEVEKLIRFALESKGFTPEYEVRDFLKKHGIADYPY